jgi:hypothetical protein
LHQTSCCFFPLQAKRSSSSPRSMLLKSRWRDGPLTETLAPNPISPLLTPAFLLLALRSCFPALFIANRERATGKISIVSPDLRTQLSAHGRYNQLNRNIHWNSLLSCLSSKNKVTGAWQSKGRDDPSPLSPHTSSLLSALSVPNLIKNRKPNQIITET